MVTNIKKDIQVYAHWQNLQEPSIMGILSVSPAKGKESFSFEYADAWLKSGFSQMIDPDLQLYSGAYYPRGDKHNFGVFLDSCPDRWGRVLMQRMEAAIATWVCSGGPRTALKIVTQKQTPIELYILLFN